MTNKKFSFLLLFLTLSLALIKSAYCVDPEQSFDLTKLDDYVGDALHVSAPVPGLIITAFLLCLTLLPLGYLFSGKNKDPTYPCLIMGLTILSLSVAMTWIPIWTFIIVCMFVALILAATFRDLITGKGRG